jgi:hypothetical protein
MIEARFDAQLLGCSVANATGLPQSLSRDRLCEAALFDHFFEPAQNCAGSFEPNLLAAATTEASL